MKSKNVFLSAAMFGILTAGTAMADKAKKAGEEAAPTGAEEAKGECWGINACKGKGECGGKGHDCAGKNACKGKGWMAMSEKDCKAKKGKYKAKEG